MPPRIGQKDGMQAMTTPRKTHGFKRTSTLLQGQIRRVGESRGFAVTRLLTHWAEIAGPDIAAVARPVEVKYGREGFGATLTILTTGAQAPMLEMQKEQLREKVNAIYGYNAISRVRITQTAPSGFHEGRASFDHAPRKSAAPRRPPTRSWAPVRPRSRAMSAMTTCDTHLKPLRGTSYPRTGNEKGFRMNRNIAAMALIVGVLALGGWWVLEQRRGPELPDRGRGQCTGNGARGGHLGHRRDDAG